MGKPKSFFDKLKQRLRFVLFDEQSYEELDSVSLTRFQLLIRLLSLLFLICSITTLTIALTPLREYIPGYAPSHLSKDLINLSLKTDSLLSEIEIKEQKFQILEKVVRGESFNDSVFYDSTISVAINEEALKASSKDSIFREAVEREGRFNVLSELDKKPSELRNIAFYAPLKGMVSDAFDLQSDHFGVDVVAPENEAIKACLPGTVILSSWTTETGYTIAIQHENDLISTYKHNSVLLKKLGALVKAGDVIAIIGNSGRLSTGPHLHFELWHKGKAINPEHHILF
ncbi:MAG: M23 family metallopeptidase [Flavobacteriales bacterium]|nr:M23 family metallopeptidase [Flavobacteriales bacterium]